MDSFYYENVDEASDGDDLRIYWDNNGWTLDRGYGGPNYKQKVSDSTNWDGLFDFITDVMPVNEEMGGILITPTQLNDLVIFSEDWDNSEDEEDDDYEED